MKRIYLTVLCFLMIVCYIGCASVSEITVDSIKDKYDPTVYKIMDYTEEQIEGIEKKVNDPSGFNLRIQYGIDEIVHIINNNTSPPDLEWTYVYRFENEKDAEIFRENRKSYADSIENGKCFRFGKIVIFGNSEVINSIGG